MENIIDVIIVRNCVHCAQIHIFGLKIQRSIFFASNAFVLEPIYTKLFVTCPSIGYDFSIAVSVIPDASTKIEEVGVSKVINKEIDWEKIDTDTHYIYEESGKTDYLKNHVAVNEFTLAIPPGGLRYEELNIIAIV